MSMKQLLAICAAWERRLFGLPALPTCGHTWIARQRAIARIHFAMGVTTSIAVGAIALLVLLTVERGSKDAFASTASALTSAERVRAH